MDKIMSPRPLFKKEEVPKNRRVERLLLGSQTTGIVFDVTRKGLIVNGYYPGGVNDKLYAILSKPIEIPWEEVEKMKKVVFAPKRKNKPIPMEFELDEAPDKKYLDKLPKVTILGRKYYIDADRRERRPVDAPEKIYSF